MQTRKVSTLLRMALALGVPSVVMAQHNQAPPPRGLAGVLGAEDAERLAIDLRMLEMGRAGREGDRSKVPQLIAALSDRKDSSIPLVALRALAQLNAAEALPEIGKLIREDPEAGSYVERLTSQYAQAVRARLLAVSSAKDIGDPAARAEAVLRRFLDELQLEVDAPDGGRAKLRVARERSGSGRDQSPNEVSVALRELADMIYHGRDLDLARAAQTLKISFWQEPAAALKVRLAPLPAQERVARLVAEIASPNEFLTVHPGFAVKLAVNEGLPASRAAAAKLKEIYADRAGYESSRVRSLLKLVACVGDKEQAPVIRLFVNDADQYVAQDAKWVLPYVREGFARDALPGY